MTKSATSGYNLLKMLPLPNVKVDDISETVSAANALVGAVQVRINDVVATAADMQSLQPKEVERVECRVAKVLTPTYISTDGDRLVCRFDRPFVGFLRVTLRDAVVGENDSVVVSVTHGMNQEVMPGLMQVGLQLMNRQ